ncbi:hypothetical protein BIV57_15285 [Mangrovactinospora gilvigrisea]|uniref:tRNA adenosine deaminase-associated protein n=1 Tax=Mangrovactinospora gilvigrisea TaxID=1428644 RepID=A0A1J7CAD8_9ACTN|nr:tRNA adenosine deaminase-associated protein [Mangrovactinospora gilvigrisea]OIV36618.1 hypothetical protein BIV57_15285 [Mangrovactinospora gilvigrisea]
MAYFAALLARTEDGWEASETELDDVETLSDLADLAREAAVDDETVLVLLEQEDAWFAVARIDGEEDPRVYVSDAVAASRSSYGEIVLADLLPGQLDDELPDLDRVELEDGETEEEDEEESGPDIPEGPIGDAELLDDFGIGAKQLADLADESGMTGDALAEITEALGCADILEAVR